MADLRSASVPSAIMRSLNIAVTQQCEAPVSAHLQGTGESVEEGSTSTQALSIIHRGRDGKSPLRLSPLTTVPALANANATLSP